MPSSVMWNCMGLVITDVSEEYRLHLQVIKIQRGRDSFSSN
jgi:hypothetical protein